jgi:hypothetical protein
LTFSKTTFAQAVFHELGGATNVVYLSHDHYYKDISHKTLEERSQTNFDHPDSLDTALLVQHIRDLKQGKVANLPTYDFATHSRTPITTLVHPKKIVLVEGILIFTNPELCHECDIKVFVVSAVEDWTETRCCIRGRENFVGRENSAKKNAFRSHYATEIQFLFFFFGVDRIHFTMVFAVDPWFFSSTNQISMMWNTRMPMQIHGSYDALLEIPKNEVGLWNRSCGNIRRRSSQCTMNG